jgi:hypothetical protein
MHILYEKKMFEKKICSQIGFECLNMQKDTWNIINLYKKFIIKNLQIMKHIPQKN